MFWRCYVPIYADFKWILVFFSLKSRRQWICYIVISLYFDKVTDFQSYSVLKINNSLCSPGNFFFFLLLIFLLFFLLLLLFFLLLPLFFLLLFLFFPMSILGKNLKQKAKSLIEVLAILYLLFVYSRIVNKNYSNSNS